MKYTSKQMTFSFSITQVLHMNDENDETVVLAKPPANKIVRRPVTIDLALNGSRIDVMTQYEIKDWLNKIFKDQTFTLNHKTFDQIANELSELINDELTDGTKSPMVSLKLTNNGMGNFYTYD